MRVAVGTCDDIEGCDGSGGGQPGAGGGEGDLLVGGLVHHARCRLQPPTHSRRALRPMFYLFSRSCADEKLVPNSRRNAAE
jgi:hypothetical protein